MNLILESLDGVVDNIFVFGKDKEEHDQTSHPGAEATGIG